MLALSNAWAFKCGNEIPEMEGRLIDKYVLNIHEEILAKYEKGHHKFPNAR